MSLLLNYLPYFLVFDKFKCFLQNKNKLSISEGLLLVLTTIIESNCSLNDSCQSKGKVIKWIILIFFDTHFMLIEQNQSCFFDRNLTKHQEASSKFAHILPQET